MAMRDWILSEGESLKYKLLPVQLLVRIEHVAVKKGIDASFRDEDSFLAEYKRTGGQTHLLEEDSALIPRRSFVEKRVARMKKRREPLWENGEPTLRHLELVLNGYSPTPKRLKEWAEEQPSGIFYTEGGLLNIWLPNKPKMFEATMAAALPAVGHVNHAPIVPMSNDKKKWLYRFQGGDWAVKTISSDTDHITGRGVVVRAHKETAFQVNLPSISYMQRLGKRMGPPGDLVEDPDVKKDIGVADDDDSWMDGFGVNDRHPSGAGVSIGQRWKMPEPEWGKLGAVGGHLPKGEEIDLFDPRKMMGLEE